MLEAWLARKRKAVDRALRRLFPRGVPDRLARSMKYSLFSAGKRLRPILALAACEALGGRERDALPAACALEMIHTYSLVHDDLPSMDDDDFRRGIPTNHRAFDEATAILAGDALQSAAFELVSHDGRLVRELARAVGGAGMVGGQMLDLTKGAGLHAIHELKTAQLFRASSAMGALAARARPRAVDRLGAYGLQVGLAFQSVDDILDGEGDSRPALARARRCTDRALEAIRFLGRRGEILRSIAEHLVRRKR